MSRTQELIAIYTKKNFFHIWSPILSKICSKTNFQMGDGPFKFESQSIPFVALNLTIFYNKFFFNRVLMSK